MTGDYLKERAVRLEKAKERKQQLVKWKQEGVKLDGTAAISVACDVPSFVRLVAEGDQAKADRRWGVSGVIEEYHNGHGLFFSVRHDSGSLGYYEPRELEVTERMTARGAALLYAGAALKTAALIEKQLSARFDEGLKETIGYFRNIVQRDRRVHRSMSGERQHNTPEDPMTVEKLPTNTCPFASASASAVGDKLRGACLDLLRDLVAVRP